MPSIIANLSGHQAIILCCTFAATILAFSPSRLAAEVVGDPSVLCQAAARRSALATGVPLETLNLIGRIEANRNGRQQLQPWPWTVSVNGRSIWFDTADQAAAFVFRLFKRGSRDFRIGCFQLDYRTHAQSFTSIERMFDADLNALEAARFLKDLGAESDDWTQAANVFRASPDLAPNESQSGLETATLRFDRDRTASPASQHAITRAGLLFDEIGR